MSSVFRNRAHGTLDRIAVDLDAAVAKKQRQPVPVIECIVDRLRQLRLREELVDHLGQSRLERRHQRCAPGAPDGKPLLGTNAADLRLDSIDRLQAFDHLTREWRLDRLVDLDEFASGMGETKSKLDRAAMTAGKRLVGSITIHLSPGGEYSQFVGIENSLVGIPA